MCCCITAGGARCQFVLLLVMLLGRQLCSPFYHQCLLGDVPKWWSLPEFSTAKLENKWVLVVNKWLYWVILLIHTEIFFFRVNFTTNLKILIDQIQDCNWPERPKFHWEAQGQHFLQILFQLPKRFTWDNVITQMGKAGISHHVGGWEIYTLAQLSNRFACSVGKYWSRDLNIFLFESVVLFLPHY